ncbi:Rieske (2Fe-2S) protein [Embleya sp. NBC_00896]|uniref:Rieske (2Fe-2S) protein n=1 Tax=Embleya sp. NBC_00896 TaxID=2975961 RepID=UPI00386641D3|nr:Rieske (2Fe-2S) protein [Embleya sp. NBC_00896]
MRATDPITQPTDDPAPTRRIVVCGALVAVGGAALVACGGDDGGDDKTQDQNTAPAADKTLGPAADVPVGGGKIYDNEKVVVTQPTAGDFKAFTAVCTHQQCLVGSVSGGEIRCPCHGSRFDVATGAVLGGPAPRPLAAKPIAVANGQVVLKPA